VISSLLESMNVNTVSSVPLHIKYVKSKCHLFIYSIKIETSIYSISKQCSVHSTSLNMTRVVVTIVIIGKTSDDHLNIIPIVHRNVHYGRVKHSLWIMKMVVNINSNVCIVMDGKNMNIIHLITNLDHVKIISIEHIVPKCHSVLIIIKTNHLHILS
jgi:hypothetical protein